MIVLLLVTLFTDPYIGF